MFKNTFTKKGTQPLTFISTETELDVGWEVEHLPFLWQRVDFHAQGGDHQSQPQLNVNQWNILYFQVEFRENSELAKVDRVKIVACDAKSAVQPRSDD